MRHLLLYEAFKSSGISKTLKFLSKNNVNKTEFLNVLKRVLKNYDYPISEFTDNDVHYMSSKKAKEIRITGDYDIMNPWGIYSLRFWFSIADGYLGYSGIGADLQSSLGEDELNIIKDMGYKKGTLRKITNDNFKNLKEGDIVFGYIGSKNTNNFTKSVIYKEQRDSHHKYIIYAIQDIRNGSEPYGYDWRKYGKYSWSLGSFSTGLADDDSNSLHLFIENDNDLKIESISYTSDLYTNSRGYLEKYPANDMIEKSDFALVIYLDELIKYDSVKDIRLDREKSKSGATALLSDEDFKKINYDRYIHSLLIKKGIHKDSKYEDLKNLQNIISKFLLDNWVLVTLHRSVPDYKYNIRRFVSYLEDLINSNDKESELEHLLREYNKILKDCDHYKNRFVKSKKMVEEKGNDITNSMLDKWLDLSSYLSKKINSSPINNVDDIIVLLYKLNSISEYLNDDRVSLEGGLNGVLANFHYADSDVSASAQRYNSASEELNKENLRRIDLVKRFIDKIL